MLNRIIRYLTACLAIGAVAGCQDDLWEQEVIDDGKAAVSITLDYKPMSTALSRTRAAGDALKGLNSLYVLVYDSETKRLIDDYKWKIEDFTVSDEDRTDNNAENGLAAETNTKRASFKLPKRMKFGRYYMYAVANIPNLFADYADAIKTVDGLKSISVAWNSENIGANGQMIGSLLPRVTSLPIDDELVELDGQNTQLHAWLRRAASKVTVAFDGSGLKEGVAITLKALRVKNIPKTCLLGKDNTVGSAAGLIQTGEEVVYENGPLITKEHPFYPGVQKTAADGTVSWALAPEAHAETNAKTLFFYENMQGSGSELPDKSQKDENGDGFLDNLYAYKSMPYATYIEVDAYYESTNPERPGICNITYRFMLGQNVTTDYNVKRNCHYKLTLKLNGFADNPDWRIDYVTRLWVTQPEIVDYRGKYFVPNSAVANLGDDFRSDNTITVTSFMYGNDDWYQRKSQPYKIEYKELGSNQFTQTRPAWLDEFDKTSDGNGVDKLKIKYKNPYKEITVNNAFKSEKTAVYDLSTKGGTTKVNTANCYVVDAKGTYQFPLVYGNAIVEGAANSSSYTYAGWGSAFHNELYLRAFLNYKNRAIKSAYILDDLDNPTGLSASLVWQDEAGLVKDIKYVSGGKGAIQFTLGSNQEGNAVIALKDKDGAVIWSWHIWATAVDLSRTLTLTNFENNRFEIMPVNLGWCSGGSPIRYYDRHECDVKFTQIINKPGEEPQEGVSMTVKIIQEPHIALPVGNNPYYQHGRKDPFMACAGTDKSTKKWYDAAGNSSTDSPALMHAASVDEGKRTATYRSVAALIKNPEKWQNGPCVPTGATGENDPKYLPADTVFFNLWDNSMWDGNDHVTKTIYDPCPVGYHVSSINTFSGFTNTGSGTTGATNLFAATEENMLSGYKTDLYEFYTDRTKRVSIGFPQNGYRDWADDANAYRMGEGNTWHAQTVPFDWGNNAKGYAQLYLAYHLQFVRSGNAVRPQNNYYATDGMTVRPTHTLP